MGKKSGHPVKSSGVKFLSGLLFVPLFNIILDINPDVMHIVKQLLGGRVMPLLKGQARPAPWTDLVEQKTKKKETVNERRSREKKRKKHNKKMRRKHDMVVRDVLFCELRPEELRKMDVRGMSLGGTSSFVRSNQMIAQRTGSLNSHDWLKLLGPGITYILEGIGNTPVIKAILVLMDVLRKCVEATSDRIGNEDEDDHAIPRLKKEMIEALVQYEECMPESELVYMPHVGMHVPDSIFRWNSVRNYWAFFSERCIIVHYCALLCIFLHYFCITVCTLL